MTSRTTEETVERFLDAVNAGEGVPADLFDDKAVLDATVPNWRFSVQGADAVAAELSGWFADPGTFEELERRPTHGGEIVTYLQTWVENGVPHAAHQCHVLEVTDGQITRDQVFCGGRWDASLLAQMAAAAEARKH